MPRYGQTERRNPFSAGVDALLDYLAGEDVKKRQAAEQAKVDEQVQWERSIREREIMSRENQAKAAQARQDAKDQQEQQDRQKATQSAEEVDMLITEFTNTQDPVQRAQIAARIQARGGRPPVIAAPEKTKPMVVDGNLVDPDTGKVIFRGSKEPSASATNRAEQEKRLPRQVKEWAEMMVARGDSLESARQQLAKYWPKTREWAPEADLAEAAKYLQSLYLTQNPFDMRETVPMGPPGGGAVSLPQAPANAPGGAVPLPSASLPTTPPPDQSGNWKWDGQKWIPRTE